MGDNDFDQHRDDVATGDAEPLLGEEHEAPTTTELELHQLQLGDMVKCLNDGQVTTVAAMFDGEPVFEPPLHAKPPLRFVVVVPEDKSEDTEAPDNDPDFEVTGPTAEEIKTQLAKLFHVVGILQQSVVAYSQPVSQTAHTAQGIDRLLDQIFRLADDYHRKTGQNHLVGLYGEAGL